MFGCCVPAGTPPTARCPEPIVEELRRLSESAEREGIVLVLENLVNTWASTSARTVDILRRVDHPAFKANWDPANALIAGDSRVYPEGYRLLADHVAHVHVADARPGSTGPHGYDEANLLDGVIDWPNQLQDLSDTAYSGYLTIETQVPPLVGNSMTDLVRLRSMLRKLSR